MSITADIIKLRFDVQPKYDQQNHDVWGKKNHKPKKVQWYNKNRYAGYGRLIRRLTAGMSDHEQQRIRGILTEAKADFAAKA